MSLERTLRDIPRVWEVDWAIPASEGGVPWAAYDWLLNTAEDLGASEVSVLGATYDVLGRMDFAIGGTEASAMRVLPHQYTVDGITVHGISRRGYWHTKGPVLVAWADDELLTEVEGQKPPAIAVVATWPDSISGWRSLHHPRRIGQERLDQEAEFNTATVAELDSRVVRALRAGAALVNEHHSALSTDEREAVAGVLVALRSARVPVDVDALRVHLMAAGWNGKLASHVVRLAERVSRGETPRHQSFRLE